MSATNPDRIDVDLDAMCRAADAAAAVLASGGRLAGPAGVQEDVSQLIVTEDVRGVWAELADGSHVVAFVSIGVLSPGAQGDDGAGLVVELGPVIDAAAAALGVPGGSPRPIVSLADLPVALTAPDPTRTLVGAGVFDGEVAIGSVGLSSSNGAPASAAAGPMSANGAPAVNSGTRNFHLLAGVELGVSAELGRTTMSMGELLDLQPGGVIELRRTVGTPIDVMVNGTLIARGEVVVVDDAYAVRVTEVVAEKDPS